MESSATSGIAEAPEFEKVRFKIDVSIYGQPATFKRYATTEIEAEEILLNQLSEYYTRQNVKILNTIRDKTKTVSKNDTKGA